MRVLLVSPHADDICLSIGGAVSVHRAPAALLTVFSVSAWAEPHWAGERDVHSISMTRVGEDRAYCDQHEVEYLDLGLEDSAVRHALEGDLRRPSGGESTLAHTVTAGLRAAVDRHRCDVIFAPLGLGGHADHRVCHQAVRRISSDTLPVVFYEDLPYAMELPMGVIDRAAKRAGQDLRPVVVASGRPIAEKIRDAGCYTSQHKEEILSAVQAHSNRLADLTAREGLLGTSVERVWTNLSLPTLACMFEPTTRLIEGVTARTAPWIRTITVLGN